MLPLVYFKVMICFVFAMALSLYSVWTQIPTRGTEINVPCDTSEIDSRNHYCYPELAAKIFVGVAVQFTGESSSLFLMTSNRNFNSESIEPSLKMNDGANKSGVTVMSVRSSKY